MTATTIEVDAFVADSVEAIGGKLYALGIGWNTISASRFPTRHPRIGVGLIIHVPYTATNQQHEFMLFIESEDGNLVPLGPAGPGADPKTTEGEQVVRLGGQFNAGRPPDLTPGDEQVITIGLQLDGLEFTKPGKHSIVVQVDGTEMDRLTFRLKQRDNLQIQMHR